MKSVISPLTANRGEEKDIKGKTKSMDYNKFSLFGVIKLLASFTKNKKSASLSEQLTDLINAHDPEGKKITAEERTILNNIIGISDLRIDDIMIPRSDIVAIDHDIAIEDLRKIIIEKEHTRFPVFQESLDNIIGFIHTKDLFSVLGTKKKFNIQEHIRKIVIVPPSMKIPDLLVKMKNQRVHMALVLDEYGSTDGLVTMEDLIEEIVGEIQDEHDSKEEALITKIDDKTFEVRARAEIKDVEKELNINLSLEGSNEDEEIDVDTVGGLVFVMLGKIPKTGEKIKHTKGYEFEITEADLRRIKKILIHL